MPISCPSCSGVCPEKLFSHVGSADSRNLSTPIQTRATVGFNPRGSDMMPKLAPTPWQTVVERPAAGDHVVQMYRDPDLLVEVVARYCRQGLATGEAVIVIATREHRASFARRLTALGTDVPACTRRSQFVDLDADG